MLPSTRRQVHSQDASNGYHTGREGCTATTRTRKGEGARKHYGVA